VDGLLLAGDALSVRHARKIQRDPLRDRADIRGQILKNSRSSRLAVQDRTRPAVPAANTGLASLAR
jgi:hypothetical protein